MTNNKPALMLVSATSGPKGMATQAAKAGMMAMMGPKRNKPGATAEGVMISLVSNLMASAIGCSKPKGPTRLGPMRTCMKPSNLRSHKVR